MPTIDNLREMRWRAVNPSVVYNPKSGIYKFWLEHPELGSPLADEAGLDDGTTGQPFANGIVIWRDQGGEIAT